MSKLLSSEKRDVIIQAYQAGNSIRKIAADVGCSKSGVEGVLKRWRKNGSTLSNKRSGRPRILDMPACRELKKLIIEDQHRRLCAKQLQIL